MYRLIAPLPPQTEPSSVLRIEDNATIPFVSDNTDYQAYLKWLAAGNTPLPPEA